MIDWFTVGAQAVNFLVLVALLRRFLYRRVLDAIDDREAQLTSRHDRAVQRQAEADALVREVEDRKRADEAGRAARLAEARAEVDARREVLLTEARADAESARGRWAAAFDEEVAAFLQALRGRVGEAVLELTRRVLADLADETLEPRVVEVFLRRLEALPDAEREALRRSLQRSGRPAVLRSARPLPEPLIERLQQGVRRCLETALDLTAEVDPELVGGLALYADGHKLAWDVADYMAGIERLLGDALADAPGAVPAGGAA